MAIAPAPAERRDPLALDPLWPSPLPLLALEEALDRAVFQDGLSREAWLRRLAGQLHRPALLPLLWLLPRGWRLAPAALPPRLRGLAALLEEGLLSPSLLAALVDDLPHLLPPSQTGRGPDALALWSRSALPGAAGPLALPASLQALQTLVAATAGSGTGLPERGGSGAAARATAVATVPAAAPAEPGLSGALIWHNSGLAPLQSAVRQSANSLVAQLLNRLAANLLSPSDPWRFEGLSGGRAWLLLLQRSGWRMRARLRSSVASFGLGASLGDGRGGWLQVPLALPLRTGLLGTGPAGGDGEEAMALLPHASLELELQDPAGERLLLQHYQGTEGLCGWEGLNDLHRPWQNDRENGSVRWLGAPFEGEALLELIDLCEVMALVHNRAASRLGLRCGGYGSLGFCIDTTALLEQAMRGASSLFPLLLGGIWRQRLLNEAERCAPLCRATHGEALERYRLALDQLPLDLSHHGSGCSAAWRRLRACQPLSSPFLLVQRCAAGPPSAAL